MKVLVEISDQELEAIFHVRRIFEGFWNQKGGKQMLLFNAFCARLRVEVESNVVES